MSYYFYINNRPNPEQHSLSSGEMKAGIIGVDLQKAYDLVNREVLSKIMQVMGFPTLFIKWLKTTYAVTTTSILKETEDLKPGQFQIFIRFFRDVYYPW